MNESQLFANALKCASATERAAYLDKVCAGNAQLRADVEALLRAHDSDPGFLEQPVAAPGETVDEARAPDAPAPKPPVPNAPAPEPGSSERAAWC